LNSSFSVTPVLTQPNTGIKRIAAIFWRNSFLDYYSGTGSDPVNAGVGNDKKVFKQEYL